jgi:hypothetical protein
VASVDSIVLSSVPDMARSDCRNMSRFGRAQPKPVFIDGAEGVTIELSQWH